MSLPFLHKRIAVVDLETTGTAATVDRITEIGVVRIENGQVTEEWSTLVNPGVPIPPEIQALTGITDAMVRDAPAFADLLDEIFSRLDGHLFVAHNARFDYGFLKNEFRRVQKTFTADVLCTVRLSRKLYPGHTSHGLDALVERHRLHAEGRHRALGDARLVWQFMQRALMDHGGDEVSSATKALLKMPSYPPQLDADALKNLPEGPGIYIFHGVNDLPIYVGKSVNLRERVRSHFSSDHRHSNDVRLSMEIRRIEYEETAGELGALLRESQLVKQAQPLRNLRLRRNRQMVFLHLPDTSGPVDIISMEDADLAHPKGLYGPFSARPRAKEMLTRLAAEHGLCWRAIGAQSVEGPCFARQIKRCRGYCVGEETLAAHNARLATALASFAFPAWPFEGAVAIRETHPEHGWQHWHVFDRWRYLGTARTESDCQKSVVPDADLDGIEFDADIFRLLAKRFARDETNAVLVGALIKLEQ
jgi:DNA polymerase-3 subunit epsilon